MNSDSSIQILLDTDLLIFYGWWQLAVCMFAFLAFIAIWWHIGRKQKDFGQVWFALSVLCWSFSGAVEVYYAKQFKAEQLTAYHLIDDLLNTGKGVDENIYTEGPSEGLRLQRFREQQSYQLNGFRSILSLFNSLFILLCLPWFRYIPGRLESIVKSQYWKIIIGLPFLFSLFPTISKMVSRQNHAFVNELDVYYATLTLLFLGYVLWESFARRRLLMLAWLSSLCIVITFIAQIYKLTGSDVDSTLFSAIFKTSLIMIFFALALSWIKELAENIIPTSNQLFLSFDLRKNVEGKYDRAVYLRGIPGNNDGRVILTPILFELFLKFAQRKSQDEGWLEIKPKSDVRSSKNYDIQDHNEIRRLTTSLLDGVFGKGCWTDHQHKVPLKTALFEMSDKRERKIRLAIPSENITL